MPYTALTNPLFAPAMRVITAITNSFPALVTTSFANGYLTGAYVRLNIPKGYGMQQGNQLTGYITVINPTQFNIDIDTTKFDPFVVPIVLPFSLQSAQVTAIGELSVNLDSAVQNQLNTTPNYF